MENNKLIDKIMVTASCFIMLMVIIVANSIQLNDRTTVQTFHRYPNLFSPSSYAFLAMGLIFMLSILFVIYQFDINRSGRTQVKEEKYRRLRLLFSVLCLLNASRIVALHYDYIAFSFVISILGVICLGVANWTLYQEELTLSEKWFMRPFFGISLGWNVIMAINSLFILSVSIGYKGIISEIDWTLLVITAVALLSGLYALRYRNLFFSITIAWSLVGIMVKQLTYTGYYGKYPQLVFAAAAGSILLIGISIHLAIAKKRKGI